MGVARGGLLEPRLFGRLATQGRRAAVAGAAAVIFDAAELAPGQCDALRRLAARMNPAPVIAMLSFPRVEDRDNALSAGAAAVLSKPVAVEDLFWQIEALRPKDAVSARIIHAAIVTRSVSEGGAM